MYKSVVIQVTEQCNYFCDHCAASCGGIKHNKPKFIDNKISSDIISGTRTLGVSDLQITGGEPFLYFEDLIGLCDKAKSENINVTVITNGFWAASVGKAQRKLQDLVSVGVNNVLVSSSVFHKIYRPDKNLVNIAEAHKSLREDSINVSVLWTDTEIDGAAGSSTRSKVKESNMSISFSAYPLIPFGHAERLPGSLFSQGSDLSGPTPCSAVRTPSVNPQGQVFLCETGLSSKGAHRDFLSIGKISEKTPFLDILLSNMNSSKLRDMKNFGPNCSVFTNSGGAGHNCEFCRLAVD